ncbi:MAG: redoxin domain-containing protein, partial [Planctomycetota bacterium]
MTDPGNVKPVSDGPERREWSTKVFLGFLGTISCLYAAILIYHSAKPPDTVAADDDSVLELCRQLCMQYGLVSSGHIRNDAEAYVKAVQKQKLTEALAVILADTSFSPIPAQQVKLLNQKAVDFDLPNHAGMQQKLSELGHDRPVVIVFYLGYGCSHCVAQLTALDKDLHYFKELDAEVIAISSDPSEHTAERFREYGEF